MAKTTTTRRKAPAKSATKTATKPARARTKTTPARKPAVAAVKTVEPEVLRRNDLVEAIVDETGLKRRDIKSVAEALLKVMGRELDAGKVLNLQPLGKIRVARVVDGGKATVLTCKIRRKAEEPATDLALATAAE